MATETVQAELLSPRDFRMLFSPPMGERRLYEHLAAGTIRSVKLGTRLYVPRSEVTRLVQGTNSAIPVIAEDVNGAS